MSIIIATLLLVASDPCAGSTTPEVEQCLAADLARADIELNRCYAAAVTRLIRERATTTLAKLRASERGLPIAMPNATPFMNGGAKARSGVPWRSVARSGSPKRARSLSGRTG